MTELDLYKYLFVGDDALNPEMHWHGDELLIFLYYFQVADFIKDVVSKSGALEDDGMTAVLKDTYMVLDLVPICESLDIDPANILAKGESTT